MPRSLKKGPFIDLPLMKNVEAAAEAKKAIGAAVEASKRDVLCGNQRDASTVVALSHHFIEPTRWLFTQATSGGVGATR